MKQIMACEYWGKSNQNYFMGEATCDGQLWLAYQCQMNRWNCAPEHKFVLISS